MKYFPEPLQVQEVVTVNVSSLTVKRGTYIQLRIPKEDCSVENPSYHLLEVEVNEEGKTTLYSTPGLPEVHIWKND